MDSTSKLSEVPSSVSFPKQERGVLSFWKEIEAFEKSLKLSEGKPEFTFYDGPPFATGLPHYGHLLAGTIKDVVTRFAHQTGHYVSRRFGWDCHGLPVEFEIDKKLGVTCSDDVFAMGIDKYNNECRSIVTRYCSEWEVIVQRIGRWIDFKNDYKTMFPWYMESVWWVFQTMFKKGLVYRGFKVMPYSTACNTPLSNFESNLNYKDVSDPAVIVSFPLVEDENVELLAWTTTPWTLPSNLALCVNTAFTYVKFRDAESGRTWIVAKSRLIELYPAPKKGKKKAKPETPRYQILEEFLGDKLVGKEYVPLFDYYANRNATGAFHVVSDDYVTEDAGTGVVHQAPAFGEDDYRVCLAYGIVSKGSDLPCPVDDNGRFLPIVTHFAGQYVKDADTKIIAFLKENKRLVHRSQLVHSYPFCWRSDTPLIYKAVPSWFINVEQIKEDLIGNNEQTYWVPASVKEKRFHNWLRDARDWAVSRNRYWGTPLPIWVSDDGEEVVTIGSIDELEAASGVRVDDLHRETVDSITIPSKEGRGDLHRVPEVFDCWFESGSMPYAQVHYPFENKERFEATFPADFIAEGLDQTRGWFYTLMVISTALFNKPAFKNLIVNGLVLAADGKKMSKSLKNYPDPSLILEEHGADALRLYLINSPVVRAEPLRFKGEGVKGVVRDVILPWQNAYRFFVQTVHRYEKDTGSAFFPSCESAGASENVMDRWIQASLQGLIGFVHEEMHAYRLYTVVPRLLQFVEELTNWFVRLNRTRLKGGNGVEDWHVALSVLYDVLLTLSRLMCPFTPFLTEAFYQNLRKIHPNFGKGEEVPVDAVGKAECVHFVMLPEFDASRCDADIEWAFKHMKEIILLGRSIRDQKTLSLKRPVRKLVVFYTDPKLPATLEPLMSYIVAELNVLEVELSDDEAKWCSLKVMPDFRVLGKRLGKDLKGVREKIMKLTPAEVMAFMKEKTITVDGHVLSDEDMRVVREFAGDTEIYTASVSVDSTFMVALDTRQDDELRAMGWCREVVSAVQKLRKKANLEHRDKIVVFYSSAPLDPVVEQYGEGIMQPTLGMLPLRVELQTDQQPTIAEETVVIDGMEVLLKLARPSLPEPPVEVPVPVLP